MIKDDFPRLRINNIPAKYYVDISSAFKVSFPHKPSLWFRIGLFIWFGLKVREIKG